ncbi:MAG: protein phosphatase 2C domain-containing protein [Xanthomonadaceae bacterium]|nr:protein phosphatase 2C domain-containing protein [Xanthomonadaceae bacterium]
MGTKPTTDGQNAPSETTAPAETGTPESAAQTTLPPHGTESPPAIVNSGPDSGCSASPVPLATPDAAGGTEPASIRDVATLPTDDPATVNASAQPAVATAATQWLWIGKRGRLPPVPARITQQPTEIPVQVPDTVVEWADLRGLSIRGLSIRGHGHRYEGSVRQDQIALGEIGEKSLVCCAVADGLGTQPASHLGAAFAARLAASWPRAETLLTAQGTQFDCSEISAALQSEAQQRGLDPETVSTTLTFAVIARDATVGADGIPHWQVAVAQIGDSHAYRLRSGRWTALTKHDGAAESLSNVVEPLPRYSRASVWHLDMMAGDVLALTTDGTGNLLEDQPEFALELASCWQQSAPSPSALLRVLDAAVKSYDDDRTFLAIRFEAVP